MKMHKDQKSNYATYFKVKFIGNGHLSEFRDKSFILRTGANETVFWVEEELQRVYDDDLNFNYDIDKPSQETLQKNDAKYVQIQRVEPLTTKVVQEMDLVDLFENKELTFDEEDLHLIEKVQDMPVKLQNFYLQNSKNIFYYKESERIEGVDSVTYDSNVQIYVVKLKFPCITGLQQIITTKHKRVSSVIQAIRDIMQTDQ